MSAETSLVALLKGTAAVTALVGAGNAARISADRIEQGAKRPFVIFTRMSTEPFASMSGEVHETKVTLEVQCWGDTRLQAETLADAVQAAIRGASQEVVGRSSAYEDELDFEASLLTVEWWE